MTVKHSVSVLGGLATVFLATGAFAQAPAQPAGSVTTTTTQQVVQPAPATPVLTTPATTTPAPVVATTTTTTPAPVTTATTTIETTTGATGQDHDLVTGHLGVTYFGVSQIPIGSSAGFAGAAEVVTAPTVGIRYWLSKGIGIDAGLGFGLTSGSSETVAGTVTTSLSRPSAFGLLLHGGVPLALAQGKHYVFEVIPELNLGFSSGKIVANVPPGTALPPDIRRSGFLFDVGARVGSEIHFGFMGIPELALQGSVGLFVRHQSASIAQDGGVGAIAGGAGGSASTSATGIGTTVNGEPWAIFANNISAIYYF